MAFPYSVVEETARAMYGRALEGLAESRLADDAVGGDRRVISASARHFFAASFLRPSTVTTRTKPPGRGRRFKPWFGVSTAP